MTKQQFRTIKFHKKNLDLLEKIKEILEEFAAQGITITLRQLYYQLVARDIIPNQVSEYTKLSCLLTNARYNGNIDWDAIEDRVRVPTNPQIFEDIEEIIMVAMHSYKLDRWKGQEYYVELWTEKDALSSVISPLCKKWQISFIVNRGYTSASSIFESKQRLLDQVWKNKKCIILYLGDHDPSGLDMIRDIRERLEEFMNYNKGIRQENLESSIPHDYGENLNLTQDMIDNYLQVIPIALTQEQIKNYNPPPNFAKIKDPRAKDYIGTYGNTSWEVDALRPEVLQELIEKSILKYLDIEKFEQVKKKEKEDIEKLKERVKE